MPKSKPKDNTGEGHYKVPGTDITMHFEVTPTGDLEKADAESKPVIEETE